MPIEIRFHRPKFTKKAIREAKSAARLETNFDYLLWVLSPHFHFTPFGLYLAEKKRPANLRRDWQQFGRFRAEGLINHIHLDEVVQNPVLQYKFGAAAIEAWVHNLQRKRIKQSIVIYLNKTFENRRENFTLCIYSNPLRSDLAELEKSWRQRIVVATPDQFIRYADRL